MHLSQVLFGVEIIRLCASPDASITELVSDSRVATPGCLFLALPGTRTDGHLHIAEAIARGASVVVIDTAHRPPDGIPYVVVPDTRLAAAVMWNTVYGDPARHMTVIAITGTNGKTSTSYLLRALFSAATRRVGMIGTLGCYLDDTPIDIGGGGEISDTPAAMTTPDPRYLYGAIAQMREKGADTLILEASSHALFWRKVDALPIHCGIFTNLSPEHLDHHGSMDAYLRAKARLFTLCPWGLINYDDPHAAALAMLAPGCDCIPYSPSGNSAARVRAVYRQDHGMDGISYLYYSDRAVFRIHCPIPGQWTIANTLPAVTAALRLGIDPPTVQAALASFSGIRGRMERVLLPGAPFSLFLDYAHTPAALEGLLRTVRASRRSGERITLLFGCGGDRDPSKRPIMGQLASALADFVILTSDNPRTESPEAILHAVRQGMDREKPHTVIADRREAIRYAIEHAREGDILLFAGKGHETYEITADGKHPFDEGAIARAVWARCAAQPVKSPMERFDCP